MFWLSFVSVSVLSRLWAARVLLDPLSLALSVTYCFPLTGGMEIAWEAGDLGSVGFLDGLWPGDSLAIIKIIRIRIFDIYYTIQICEG